MGSRRIFVRDLKLTASIGVLDHERETPQDLIVTITLDVDDRPLARDHIEEAVDYRRPVEHARAILEAGHIDLVETFAERLAEACLAEPGVLAAQIRVEKPAAIPGAAAAGVEITRHRESAI